MRWLTGDEPFSTPCFPPILILIFSFPFLSFRCLFHFCTLPSLSSLLSHLAFISYSSYLAFFPLSLFPALSPNLPFISSPFSFSFPPILPFFSSPFSYSSLLFCLSFPAHFTFCTFTLYSDLLTVVTAWMRTSRAHSVCFYWMNCLYWCRTPPLAASSPTAYSLERPPSPKRKNSGKEQRLCWWKLNSI